MRIRETGLFLGVLLASLLTAEVVLRFLAPVPAGTEAPPGESLRVTVKQTLPGLQPEITYQRNAYGLRTTARIPGPREPGVTRILCLGASTTDQATQSLEDMWCSRLAEGLNRQFAEASLRFEAAAFGRGGYRAVDLLAWAQDSLAAIQADLVVLLVGINDLALVGGPEYRYAGLDASLARSRAVRSHPKAEPSRLYRFCPAPFQLCRRVVHLKKRLSTNSLEWHSAELPRLRAEYRELPVVAEPRREPDPIVEFREAADSLTGLLQASGIRTVLVGQPTLWSAQATDEARATWWFGIQTPLGAVRPSGAWLSSEMARYNAVLESVARNRSAAYVDLPGMIPRTLEYFFDDCHFTDRGSAKVAELLASRIAVLLAAASLVHVGSGPHHAGPGESRRRKPL